MTHLELENETIADALRILRSRIRKPGVSMLDIRSVKDYLVLNHATKGHEIFGMVLTCVKSRFIADIELFRGTLTDTAVYPREVIKEALALNASGVLIYHNHPSGTLHPTASDLHLTEELKFIFSKVDILLIDHIIVCGHQTYSFAENGQI